MRVENLTGRDICRMCDDGLALVARRPQGGGTADEFGPCPHCEAGERLEFHGPGSKLWPTWGRDGFWRGREPAVFAPEPEGQALPRAENALRMRLLMRRMGGAEVDPLVGVDVRDPARRLAILERAAAK